MGVAEAPPGLAHRLPRRRVREQPRRLPRERVGIHDLNRRAGRDGFRRSLREVEGRRTDEDRDADRAGLDQVLRAIGQQAAADVDDVRAGVVRGHLPHAVAEGEGLSGRHRPPFAPAYEREAAAAQERRHLVEALRMARHDHGQRAGERRARQRVQNQRLLAFARARREEHQARAEQAPELAAAGDQLGRRRDVELEIPGHLGAARAERGEPRGVGLGLGRNRREVRERFPRQRPDATVALGGPLRKPCVREQHGHARAPAFAQEVGPDLGLHHDAETGAEVRDEPPHCPRQVIGQEREGGEFAVQARRRFAPGGRHVRQNQRVIRKARPEGVHEGLCGARFAERHRVDPDDRPRRAGAVTPEALADVPPVAGLLAPAPPKAQRDVRQREMQRDVVERAEHQASAGATSPSASSTSAAEGGRPAPPRIAIRPGPSGPVRAGSELQ